jgi:hypothetical protein
MSEFKGFVVKNSLGQIVFSSSRHSEVRKECERLNLLGKDRFVIEENWKGTPTSVITRTRRI